MNNLSILTPNMKPLSETLEQRIMSESLTPVQEKVKELSNDL